MGGPTFLGVGAPKTGTTWLHEALRHHPQVWLPPVKELHYFDREPSYLSPNELATAAPLRRLLGLRPWEARRSAAHLVRLLGALARGDREEAAWRREMLTARFDDAWYARLFDRRPEPQRGEITPAYAMLRPKDIARMKAMNPRVRLILIVRDPVEREWSGLRAAAGRGRLGFPIERTEQVLELLAQGHDRAARGHRSRGDYRDAIEGYLAFFPPEQMLVVFYDAIAAVPAQALAAVCDFLGVDAPPAGTAPARPVNASPPQPMPEPVRALLRERHGELTAWLAARLGGYAVRWLDPAAGDGSPPPSAVRLDRASAI